MQPTPRDEFVHGIFTTAMEGGVQYWAEVQRYRWCINGNTSNPDYKFFRAVLRDNEGESDEDDGQLWVVDRATVERGLERMAEPLVGISEARRGQILAAIGLCDAGEIDADLADCIVQAGLFGEVRYG